MSKAAFLLSLCGILGLASGGAFAEEGKVVSRKVAVTETCTDGKCGPKFTDEQLDRIHAIKLKYADAGSNRMSELHKLHRQMGEAMEQININRADVVALQGKISTLEAEAASDRTQMALDLHEVFTVEQRQAMRRHMLEHDLPGPGHGPGMPPPFMFGGPGFGPGPGGGFGPGGPGGPGGPPHPPGL